MSMLVESETAQPSAGPDAGVIRDAQQRRNRRRKRVAGILFAGAALGVLVTWLAGHSNSKSTPAGHVRGQLSAFEHTRRSGPLARWHISPALEGGDYGWCVLEGGNGGSCATVPTKNARTVRGVISIGTIVGTNIARHEDRIIALLAAEVRGVLANGHLATLVTKAQLPYKLRLVQIDFPRRTPPTVRGRRGSATVVGPHGPRTRGGPPPETTPEVTPTLLATGANGKPLTYINPEPAGIAGREVRWWKSPAPLPSGPCQIHARGLPPLEPKWGHVAAEIRPYPAKIIGRTFFSCIDIEYYMHHWPLETAILLDAQHPGSFPAAIPGMSAIPGAPGLFSAPGDWHGEITAARHGNAWLVVAGGSGLLQREEVLRHLDAKVTL